MNMMLLRMLLTASFGLALALLLRKPMRRIFGAGPAFTLWCLPLLLAAMPWIPASFETPALQPIIAALPSQTYITPDDAPSVIYAWLIAVWLLGVAYGIVNLTFRYVRLARACGPMPEIMQRRLTREYPSLPMRRVCLHVAGPAVMWAPRARLLLPADFFERQDAEAREMVLRHECTHLRRGDAWWSLLSECLLILLWFHPLAWFALPRFQLDQELACDENVLRASPRYEAPYARTLMRSTGVDAQPAMIPWLAESQLKERLTMISRPPRSSWRRRIGYVTLASLFASSALLAQTSTAPPVDRTAAQDIDYNAAQRPMYPQDAIKNREQGMVLLKVLVGADGVARQINVDPKTQASPELTKAASDAAMKWRYNPKIEGGKAVESWVTVPVMFSLAPLPPHPPGPPPRPGTVPPPPPPPGMLPPPPPPPPGGPSSSNS
ncbi:TonB family protein [Dyella sp. 2HG41-7]|uniref:TonB family protein n=1 Tax=Dyella sp. 2HG41-7 TaxID=2883239 RepID=UPI001F399DFB|nr:TonB family protein [Dyella sp. 2HG41-7]